MINFEYQLSLLIGKQVSIQYKRIYFSGKLEKYGWCLTNSYGINIQKNNADVAYIIFDPNEVLNIILPISDDLSYGANIFLR